MRFKFCLLFCFGVSMLRKYTDFHKGPVKTVSVEKDRTGGLLQKSLVRVQTHGGKRLVVWHEK